MNAKTHDTPQHFTPSRGSLRLRHLRVMLFFTRLFLSAIFIDVLLARMGFRFLTSRTATRRYQRAARRFRLMAASLGGVWIKVGQFLSARVDMLPVAVTAELAGLQDEVAPEPFEAMRAMIEAEFAEPLERRYVWFDPHPLASASLGQVHRARLGSGESVVVKVQRPGIHDLIGVDLAALATVLKWLKQYKPITRRADLDELLSEFSRTLWQEVDYIAEADHARRFGEMFAKNPKLRIPTVFGDHTTKRVLTLEDVYFIKIFDYSGIEAAGVDRSEVAKRLFNTYLRQIFIEGFFHADPHPGNLFVEPLDEGGWRLIFVDFGMVGRLSPEAKDGLRNAAIALGTRDVDRLIQSYQQLGMLLPGADLDRIRQAERVLMQRIWGRSMRELVRLHPKEMQEFAHQFQDLLYEMPFQVPMDLLFLGRCVAILSGMCTGLDPDFNLFEGLAPFAQQLLSEERGDWVDTLLSWMIEQGSALVSLPARVDSTLSLLDRGELVVTARAGPDLALRLRALTRAINRLVAAVIFAAFLLVGGLFYANGDLLIGGIGFGLAVLALLWLLRG
ncbi:MAG: AarF/UbiB family protein [Anaerolineales bacterium]